MAYAVSASQTTAEDFNKAVDFKQNPNGTLGIYKRTHQVKLQPGHMYQVAEVHNGEQWEYGLKEANTPIAPVKEIWSEEQLDLLESTHKWLNIPGPTVLGFIFHGEKGAGKTTMAQRIALMANAPILIMDPKLRYEIHDMIIDAYSGDTIVCLMEESDRFKADEEQLIFMDKNRQSKKKIIIQCTNKLEKLEERTKDRPGRARYVVAFNKINDLNLIENIVARYPVKNTERVSNFIKSVIKNPVMDTITAFLEELEIMGFISDPNIGKEQMLRAIKNLNIEKNTDNVNMQPVSIKTMHYSANMTASDMWDMYMDMHKTSNPTKAEEKFWTHFQQYLDDPKLSGKDRLRQFYRAA
jgi:ABC-type polar amino acid transport system ATPase subunit